MFNKSFNVIYVVICSGCLEECIGKTGGGKTRLRHRVRVQIQPIKQTDHQQLKFDEHTQVCERASFKTFPFPQM